MSTKSSCPDGIFIGKRGPAIHTEVKAVGSMNDDLLREMILWTIEIHTKWSISCCHKGWRDWRYRRSCWRCRSEQCRGRSYRDGGYCCRVRTCCDAHCSGVGRDSIARDGFCLQSKSSQTINGGMLTDVSSVSVTVFVYSAGHNWP